MAKDNNLTDFLKDIADAIRTAEGLDSSTTIPAQQFSDHIQFLGNWEPLQVTPSNERQEFTQAGQGYSAFLPVVVTAMPSGTANIRDRTSGGTAIAYGKEVHLSAGYYSSRIYYNSVGSASVSAYFSDNDSLSNYFNEGTSSDYGVAITYGDTVSTAGYVSSNSRSTKYYKIKTGSATTPATSITANPGTPTWDSTNSNYVISVNATKNVTPTVSAGWVGSGTAGTITVSGSSTLAQSTFAGATVPSGVTPTTLAKNTSYKLSAGYYPSDRYYKTQADPTLSGDAAVGDVLDGKTFYNTNYTKKTGTMTNNGAIAAVKNPTFSGATASYTYTVPAGYHNGSGTVSGSVTMSTASISAYFDDGGSMSTYFNSGTTDDYDAAFTYGDTVSSAGYTSSNHRLSKFYKIKVGSASASHTLTELSSVSSSVTTVNKQLFSVQGKGTVSTTGWISSVSNGTTTYYKVKDGSATTPTASGAATATLLSGTTLTVSRNVTPTVVAGWVSSGTVGTVTITGTVPTQSKSATPTGTEQTISPDSGKLLSSVTVNPPEIEGLCKYQVYTTENRILSGNSTISPINLTINTLSSSKTYNIIIMLGGYGWGPTSTSAPNTGGILGLYNVPGNSFPSTITASKTFEANGFGGGSYSSGTFTVSVGVYNSTTIRIATSASGLNNQYPGAAYVDVKMVIIQEVD